MKKCEGRSGGEIRHEKWSRERESKRWIKFCNRGEGKRRHDEEIVRRCRINNEKDKDEERW